jgi:hypothetical protein
MSSSSKATCTRTAALLWGNLYGVSSAGFEVHEAGLGGVSLASVGVFNLASDPPVPYKWSRRTLDSDVGHAPASTRPPRILEPWRGVQLPSSHHYRIRLFYDLLWGKRLTRESARGHWTSPLQIEAPALMHGGACDSADRQETASKAAPLMLWRWDNGITSRNGSLGNQRPSIQFTRPIVARVRLIESDHWLRFLIYRFDGHQLQHTETYADIWHWQYLWRHDACSIILL